MGRTGQIKAGEAFVELSLHDRTQRALGRVQARLKRFGRDTAALGRSMLTVGAAALGPLAGALKTFSSLGDATAKMARRTGLSVEAVQSLGFAAERSGSSTEALEKGVRRMQRTVWDATRGLSTANDALDELGLTADDLAGKSPEEQFKILADALHGVDGASRRAAIAQQIFGRSGTELLPMFEKGRAGLEALQDRFHSLGVTLSSEETQAAERFTDQLTNLWTGLKYGVALIGSRLEPAIRDLLGTAQDTIREWAGWIKNNRGLITSYARLALEVGKWVALIGGGLLVVGKFAGAIGSLIGVVKGLSAATAALIANPVALAFVGAAAVIGGVVYAMDRLTTHYAELRHEAEQALGTQRRQNAADLERIERLQALADKESLTNREREKAQDLIDTLNNHLGDYGATVDETTGKVHGLAEATDGWRKTMQQVTIAKAQAEVMELQHNLDELRTEFYSRTQSPLRVWREMFGADALGELDERIDVARAKLEAARKHLQALEEGPVTRQELTGQDEAADTGPDLGPAEDAARNLADLDRTLTTRLHRLRLEMIEDEHARRIALINHRYDVERQRLKEQGATAEQLATLQAARQAELAKARQDAERKRAEENDRREREWKQQRLAELDYERDLRQQLAREEIRATKEGKEERFALLELQRKAAIREAAEYGQDAIDLVNRLYDAKRRAIEGADEADRVARSTRGTFGSFRAGASLAVASVAERTAKAVEETARNTKRLVEEARRGGPVFG